ncbi:MAG: hypothetical protein WC849_02245 [Candidatus Paceibacterota bacterium]
MFYLIYGTDFKKGREKVKNLTSSLLVKKPNSNLFRLDSENFDEAVVEESLKGRGLFENKYIVFFDKVFENEKNRNFILEKIKEISKSENIFVLLEEKIDKKTLTKLEKHSQRTQEFNETERKIAERAKPFSLTDALGRRDKKKAWAEYQKILKEGLVPEEIHGILFWQIKTMILSSSSKTSAEADLNPFVFKKAKEFSKNYSEKELNEMSSKLISIYHDIRRGITEDLGLEIEKFLLEI